MASNFEKSVKGATKVKLAPPKSKYIEHLLLATQSGEAGVAEVFRTLIHRLRDSTWTVAFKSLIVVHLMIKEGAQDATLKYLSVAPRNRLAINTYTDVQTQGTNIRRYSEYLLARAEAYAASRCDYARSGEGRMKRLTVDKGLLRETEVVQEQIKMLVKCNLLDNDVENEISLTAFRLLTRDLLDLYNVENEAVMNVLGHYFEMSRPDAERAVNIYKAFCKQTDQVVQYLSVARQYEHATRLEIPKIRHAPTSLVNSLQEYLDDKDFEVNRRQYLAEQEAKRTGRPVQKASAPAKAANDTSSAALPSNQPAPAASAPAAQPTKGPAPDLIDFFESIEQNQQPMAQNAQPFQQQQQQPPVGFPMQSQQTGFAPQQAFGFQQAQPNGPNGYMTSHASTNPFGQLQQPPAQMQFTGAGFSEFGPQSPQQQQPFPTQDAFSPVQVQGPPQIQASQGLQPQQTGSTNPFRQSMMPTGVAPTNAFGQQNLQRSATNPFARQSPSPAPPSHEFQQQPGPFSPQQTQQLQLQPLQTQATGTNPFARNLSPPQQPESGHATPTALQVQPTGSTNPFRQSMFINQQTGQGWQTGPQATMGGLESLETVPVFPRPGQMAAPPQQQQQQSPWG